MLLMNQILLVKIFENSLKGSPFQCFRETKNVSKLKAAFMACIDKAPATPEYKLLQLQQCLTGEALKAIESLGYSAAA